MSLLPKSNEKTPTQRVEEGKRRLEALTVRRTRAITIAESARKNFEDAKIECEKIYGVNDIESCRRLKEAILLDGERKAAAFEAELDLAESQLDEVERKQSR